MHSVVDRIDELDPTLFNGVPSQTSDDDRRALLAIQRAVARKYGEFVYLEIGSYLGGSLQPYLLDSRCRLIYSIDPRPAAPQDGNTYDDNSAENMLRLLSGLDPSAVSKITCFSVDAGEVDIRSINPRPQVAFIDGDHTRAAVLADFRFCQEVIAPAGIIAFHDSQFRDVTPAIYRIVRKLQRRRRKFAAVKFDGAVFAIFFGEELASSDAFISDALTRNRTWLFRVHRRRRLSGFVKACLPASVVTTVQQIRRKFIRPEVEEGSC